MKTETIELQGRLRPGLRRARLLGAASAAAIFAALLAGCGLEGESSGQPSAAATATPAPPATPVETLKLQRQSFQESFEAPGTLEAEEDVTISAETSGRIVELTCDTGDEVEKGQLLLALDSSATEARMTQLSAQIARSETMLAQAERELARQKDLFERGVGAKKAFEDAETQQSMYGNELAAAKAELEVARVELDRARIAAPLAGVVARRHVAVGEFVNPGLKLLDIVAVDRVKFAFSLSEADVTRAKPGDPIAIKLDALPDLALEGKIRSIAPAGELATRTFRVELILDNPDPHPLRPGMSGRARIVRQTFDGVFIIPEEAIRREVTRNYILWNDGGAARAEAVKILSAIGERAVISAGLADGAECVILGQHAIQDGSPIRARKVHDEIPALVFE